MIEFILILSVINVVLGIVAVWQRHITYTVVREANGAHDGRHRVPRD